MTYAEAMDKAARDYLTEVLQSVRGNMEKAAAIADYDRAHFYVLCRRNGIDYTAFRDQPDQLDLCSVAGHIGSTNATRLSAPV
jgi:hypothetical protein